MDVHSSETRSYNMSQIKGKNTKPELLVRKFLHAHGYRYTLHDKRLPGKPDIVLKKYKAIVDVRGCFWHLHQGCKYGELVNTPSEKMTSKRKFAVQRDEINMSLWNEAGWKVIVIWGECQLEPRKKLSKKREQTLNNILNNLKL
ncbi:very short patch repair endonuclease [Altibacter sp. HG106]|uniref:very short patch repair endonuclease n=1 Tax=Altibacter sp. HG106 TaxID=3023937 RepID=UPI002350C89F|nr:very short patch repair endonuclease [Altibacter sp. HG106]MDC7993542.1 very short patch repair endonuclease [Altibacter sp. HG106]